MMVKNVHTDAYFKRVLDYQLTSNNLYQSYDTISIEIFEKRGLISYENSELRSDCIDAESVVR